MALVTVAEFDNSIKAHLAKMQLEMEGVESFLIDLETTTMDWFLGRAIGLIKLQVREEDKEKAFDIIATSGGGANGESRAISTGWIFWVIIGAVVAVFAYAFTQQRDLL